MPKYTNISFPALRILIEAALKLVTVSNTDQAGDGTETTFTYAMDSAVPTGGRIKPGTVTVTDGTESFTDDSNGTLTGDAGGTGTVDYVTGAISVTFNAAVTNAQDITLAYSAGLGDLRMAVKPTHAAGEDGGSMGLNRATYEVTDFGTGHKVLFTIKMDSSPNLNQLAVGQSL